MSAPARGLGRSPAIMVHWYHGRKEPKGCRKAGGGEGIFRARGRTGADRRPHGETAAEGVEGVRRAEGSDARRSARTHRAARLRGKGSLQARIAQADLGTEADLSPGPGRLREPPAGRAGRGPVASLSALSSRLDPVHSL